MTSLQGLLSPRPMLCLDLPSPGPTVQVCLPRGKQGMASFRFSLAESPECFNVQAHMLPEPCCQGRCWSRRKWLNREPSTAAPRGMSFPCDADKQKNTKGKKTRDPRPGWSVWPWHVLPMSTWISPGVCEGRGVSEQVWGGGGLATAWCPVRSGSLPCTLSYQDRFWSPVTPNCSHELESNYLVLIILS